MLRFFVVFFSKGSLNLSEDDSEDSTADSNYVKKNARTTTLPTIHETSVLEEGKTNANKNQID